MRERSIFRGFLSVFSLLLFLGQALPATASDGLSGIWLDQDKKGYIEITQDGVMAQGRIAGSVKGKVDTDINNPDPALRSRSLLGQRILKDLQYDGSRYWLGSIYNPLDGRTYSARVSVVDANTIAVHGYIGMPLLGQTQKWTRVTDKDALGLKSSQSSSDSLSM